MTDHRIDPNKIKLTRTPSPTAGFYGLKMEDTASGIGVVHLEVTNETHMKIVADMLLELSDKKKKSST